MLTVPAPAAHPWIALLCLIGLIGLLGLAALSDLRRRRIANHACLGVALLAMPYWLAMEPAHPARIALQIGLALAIGLPLLLLFAIDLIGGGDVKLLAALALWLRPADVGHCLVLVSVAGGLLGVGVAIASRRRIARPTVPYGLAIAVGGLAIVAPRCWPLIG
jgi:prepilin peptidase CpaA